MVKKPAHDHPQGGIPHHWKLQLNEQQQTAVASESQYLAIVAGPGTGKTLTLAARLAFLLEKGQDPDTICALTFTQKAATELRDRVIQLVGSHTKLPFIGTFHSLAYQRILQLTAGLRIVSVKEREQLLTTVLKARGKKKNALKEAQHTLSLFHSKSVLFSSLSPENQQLVTAYQEALEEAKAVDFDGLLWRWYQALQQDTQPPFQHVLIDEFQDTNPLQLEIVSLLCAETGSLCVIGDPRQAIYGFRGASSEGFEWLKHQFPQLTEITLQTNYRCAQKILHTAQCLFPQDTKLHPAQTQQGLVRLTETLDEHTEADLIVRDIEQIVGGTDLLASAASSPSLGETFSASFADIAVVYRSKGLCQQFMTVLSLKGIPYRVVGNESMFLQPKCVLTLVSLYVNLGGTWEELVELQPELASQTEINKSVMEALRPDKGKTLLELAQDLARQTGWEDVLEKKKLMKNQWQQWLSGLTRFTGENASTECRAALAEQLTHQEVEVQADRVTLLTMHAAKGLEFPHVFVLACEDGSIPHSKATNQDEEERLLYVALTRAKSSLMISFAKKRRGLSVRHSPFLKKIIGNTVNTNQDTALPAVLQKRAKYQAKKNQLALF